MEQRVRKLEFEMEMAKFRADIRRTIRVNTCIYMAGLTVLMTAYTAINQLLG